MDLACDERLFEVLSWRDARTIVWMQHPEGNTVEFLHLIFPEMSRMLGDKTDVGVVIDLRGSRPPDAAARSAIQAHFTSIAPQLRGIALVLDESPVSSFMGTIARFMVGHVTGLILRTHTSTERAFEWIDQVGEGT